MLFDLFESGPECHDVVTTRLEPMFDDTTTRPVACISEGVVYDPFGSSRRDVGVRGRQDGSGECRWGQGLYRL
jgi:hypothetical protein